MYKDAETVGSASYDFRTPAISTVNFGRYPYSHPNSLLYQMINLDAKCELHEVIYRKDMFALVHHCAIAARATRKYDLAMALYRTGLHLYVPILVVASRIRCSLK